MKQTLLKGSIVKLRICIAAFLLVIISLFLFSFTANKMTDDFLKQLGISQTEADKKITNSLIGGYVNASGLRNAKNIVLGNRSAVVKDLLSYIKLHTNGSVFIKEYTSLRENQKPVFKPVQTPDEYQKQLIENNKKAVANFETMMKKADASFKPTVEKMLVDARNELKDAENSNNKEVATYRKSYSQLVEDFDASNQQQINQWETEYPANHLLFIKKRLEQFLEETKDIDFAAELTLKGSKKIFVNPKYEGKRYYWKMAFRAGKEVVEPARLFVQQWLGEIK